MDIYHAWCDLKPGVSDIVFSEQVAAYLGHLKADGRIEGWRLIPGASWGWRRLGSASSI
jgi:hypothetical protein